MRPARKLPIPAPLTVQRIRNDTRRKAPDPVSRNSVMIFGGVDGISRHHLVIVARNHPKACTRKVGCFQNRPKKRISERTSVIPQFRVYTHTRRYAWFKLCWQLTCTGKLGLKSPPPHHSIIRRLMPLPPHVRQREDRRCLKLPIRFHSTVCPACCWMGKCELPIWAALC